MNRTFLKSTLALALLAAGLPAAQAQKAVTWRFASYLPDSNFHTQNLRQFGADIEKATEGRVKVTVSSNSALFRLPEIKRAVSTSQIQGGEAILSAYGNEDKIYEVDVVPYLATGYDGAWKLYQATKDLLVRKLDEQGIHLLYSVAWPGSGFYSVAPIESTTDLKGRKVRAAAPLMTRFNEALGMMPQVIQVPELSQAFSSGMINMMYTSAPMGPQMQIWEFTKYYYDIQSLLGRQSTFMNKRALAALSEADRAAVLKAAAEAEKRGWDMSRAADDEAKAQFRKNGMWVGNVTPGIEADLRKAARPVIEDWLKTTTPELRKAVEPLVGG